MCQCSANLWIDFGRPNDLLFTLARKLISEAGRTLYEERLIYRVSHTREITYEWIRKIKIYTGIDSIKFIDMCPTWTSG